MSTLLLAVALLFPTVKGSSLAGRDYVLPHDLEGKVRMVIIAFKREQQLMVNTWQPMVQDLLKANPDLHFYELPTMSSGYKIMRPIIDGGMRSGIKDPVARESTITLYINKGKFMKALDIPSDEVIQTMLIDSTGHVRFRAEGEMTPIKAQKLREAVQELYKSETDNRP
jgi:hypothetical protein